MTALDALPLAVFAVMIWLLTAFAGGSIGQRLLGLVVTRLDGGPTGPVRGGLRTGLILLVIPPLVVDADGRGLHDRLAGTLIRRR